MLYQTFEKENLKTQNKFITDHMLDLDL